MGSCCEGNKLDSRNAKQRKTLMAVLLINAVMFVVIVLAALHSRSSSLLSDSLDNLGDAITYAVSLYAISKTPVFKAKVALFKGGLIFFAACLVLIQVIYKLEHPVVPTAEIMGIFSLLGLIANALCLFLLTRHRREDVNMSSVWACARNDIVSNISVFIGAWLVWFTASGWPDMVIAVILVVFLMRSSIQVIRSALRAL